MFKFLLKKIHRKIPLLLLATALFSEADAQTFKLKGQVVDPKGGSLPGVSVQLKDGKAGTVTNNEGQFELNAPVATGVLVFKYIGYTTKELTANSNAALRVVLEEANEQLGEVVVVGYGTQKKVTLTGSVSVIDGKSLTNRQVGSASLALQGAAPGVTIRQQSGVPGGDGGVISIRGVGSINAGSNPLVLVDNVEMSLDAIDPNSIESISVLKDAAASAVYGSRAANGVILVTTKRGASGVKVSYSGYVTKQEATDLPVKVNGLDHMKLWDVAQVNAGLPPAFTQQIADYERLGPDNFARFNTDWKKLVLTNNGMMQNHNLNISAGTDKIKMFASGGYLKQNGLTATTDFNRKDLRFNTDITLTRNLSASMDLVLNKSERTWPGNNTAPGIIRYMLGLPAVAPGRFDGGQWGEGWSNTNPAAQAEDGGFDKTFGDSRIISGTLTYKPLEGLELLANYSSNAAEQHNRKLQGQYDIYVPDLANNKLNFARVWPANNGLFDNTSKSDRNLFRVQATYSKAFGDHEVKILGGFSTETFNTSFVNAFRQNLISEDLPYLNLGDAIGQTLSGGASELNMASAYSRINYNYKEKYLLELNGRFDASSRFIKENWWKLFPSMSAGWRISNEEFWSNLKSKVNEAKLRVSYGELGNQAIRRGGVEDYYPAIATYNGGFPYYFNNVINNGYAINTAANPYIQWETSKVLDIGADFGFLNNRLTVTADYFRRDVGNMLMPDVIPNYVGLTNAPFINVGTMRNSGWELGLTWKDKVSDFSYQVTANISDVKNKLTNLNSKEYISGALITREGYAYNSYYGYIADGLFQSDAEVGAGPFHFANTKAGDIRYKDISGPNGAPDNKIDAYDRAIIGNSFPRYEYSFNLAAQFKGFDFTAFLQGVGKMDNYLSGTGSQPFYSANFQGSIFDYQTDYWSPENKGAAYPRLLPNSIANNYVTSSFWMRSGAYLRLKNVVLGYTLPKKISDQLKLGSARLYVSGQNLATWSKFFPGFDPEQKDTAGEFYPIMRTYTVGLNVNF
uniref:SusC/RagA family TonB-linked outer membrane protein n=1 Tax=Pedobacter schmidteae TaxID=2201271 RepID=UPI000EB21185|nr:TonB-dependent receptor [Pedobacter schmidteae]